MDSIPPHPYLFFSREDVPALRARMEREPFATRWAWLKANADGVLDDPPSDQPRWNLGNAGTTAFAYALTGERRYAERAKQEILAMARRSVWHQTDIGVWNRGADLTTAERCLAAALVYDWCHDVLTPEERGIIRDAVVGKGFRRYLISIEGGREDWWVDNPVSNWCGVLHGGCGVAALALLGEAPEAAQVLESARRRAPAFLDRVILADGGGHEGVMYFRYGVTWALYLAVAAHRRFGGGEETFADITRKMAGHWDVAMQAPDGRYANFNNMNEETFSGLLSQRRGNGEGGPDSTLCALWDSLAPQGDPLLRWGADNGGVPFMWRSASPFWLLWRRDAPLAGPKPAPQDAVLFRDTGHAIFRSPRLWLAYNGGWISDRSHHNLDLGTFVLVADGERLVHDYGYARAGIGGRTQDHSTVLVDGQEQTRGAGASYRRFGSGKGFHYLASDLSRCYDGETPRRFVRQLVMVDGEYVVLLDDLAADAPAEFEWRLQTRHADVAVGERSAAINGESVTLHVVAAAPEGARVVRGKAALGFVGIQPPERVAEATLVTVLYPTACGGAAPEARFDADGTLTVTRPGGKSDTLRFARGAGGWELRAVNGEDATGTPSGAERTLRPVAWPAGSEVGTPPAWVLGAGP